MKRILILETNAFNGHKRGGSYIQGEYYKKKLIKKGYDVELFVGRGKKSAYARFSDVIKKIREADYVIGFGTPLLGFYLQWLSFVFKKKGIYCVDSIITSVQIIKDYFKKRLFPWKMIFENYKALLLDIISKSFMPPKLNLVTIASSEYVRDKLSNYNIKTIERKYLFPRIPLSKRRTTNPKIKTVLFYGTLFRGRGVLDLVRACGLLWERNYKFKLIILGWPVIQLTKISLLKAIRSASRENIIIKGYVKRPKEYLLKATVVVLPFRYPCAFQTPYTLLEPMSLGIPVITTDVGSHKEWVKDGYTGIICEKENIEDIALKIERALNDGPLVRKITEGAYQMLQEKMKEKDLLMQTLKKLDKYER